MKHKLIGVFQIIGFDLPSLGFFFHVENCANGQFDSN